MRPAIEAGLIVLTRSRRSVYETSSS